MTDALSAGPPPLPTATPEQRARIDRVARDYEASFLSIMLGQMQAGVSAGGFGGGQGEAAFKSFLNDAVARSLAGRGGVGLAPRLSAEMLRMQGLAA